MFDTKTTFEIFSFLGNLEMVDILLEAGADLTYENAVGTDISQNNIINIFQFTSVSMFRILIGVQFKVHS
jgi:hypothetical protein